MPYNAQFPPAGWDTMNRAQRQKWRTKHWRPWEWQVEAPLKREATRNEKRQAKAAHRKGAGGGMDLGAFAKALGL